MAIREAFPALQVQGIEIIPAANPLAAEQSEIAFGEPAALKRSQVKFTLALLVDREIASRERTASKRRSMDPGKLHFRIQKGLKGTSIHVVQLAADRREADVAVVQDSGLDKCSYYHNYLEIFAGTELFNTHKQYGIELKEVYPQAVNRLYKTIYAYDVYSVPEIAERSLANTKLQTKEMAAALCGDAFLFKPTPDGIYPSLVVFTNMTFANAASMNWYMQNAGSGTRVAMVWQMEEPGDFDSHRTYEMHMPFQMFYGLMDRYPDADQITLLDKAFKHNSENFTPYSISFLDINDFENGKATPQSAAGNVQQIFQIQQNSTGVSYSGEVNKLLVLNDMVYRNQIPDVNFLDVCRWSPALCPAKTMDRVIVDGNSNLYPCFTGRPVGRIGEKIGVTRHRTSNLVDRIQHIRRCSSCPARHRCSKCLFPYPMTASEFCSIQLSLGD